MGIIKNNYPGQSSCIFSLMITTIFTNMTSLKAHFHILFSVFFTLISLSCIAQDVQDDFEGNSTITSWFGDACGMNNNFSNPVQQGINTSPTVLEYNDTGGQYANVRFDAASNFNFAIKNSFKLNIYVSSGGITGLAPNQISLKLQDGSLAEPWVTQSEIIKPIQLNQWQEVTFNFENDNFINLDGGSLPPIQRTDFNRIVIQVNGENNNDSVLAYLDDILFYELEDTGTGPDAVFDYLVWSDEFNGSGAINSLNWFHQTQIPSFGSWYNDEQQHYTDRVENSFESNGNLNLTAINETYTDQGFTKQYTSARLNSKFAFTYGKVEVRAKLPSGLGTWPAIWMLGQNITEGGAYWETQGYGTTPWPACGEVDIMEHWGSNQNFVQSAMHTPSSSGATVNHGGQNITTASSEFHVYTMEWSSERITFSVDGNTHYTYNPLVKDASTWPFDAPQYVLLNFAIQPAIAASFTEDAMEVDFVRIYQTSPELFCQGDIDNNGAIDIIDLGLLLGDFGCSDFDCVADLNNDGSTNLGDISIFLIVFGALCD